MRTIAVRLRPGADLKAELAALAAREGVRVVSCPPALTALFHAHIQEFGCRRTGGCWSASATAASCPR